MCTLSLIPRPNSGLRVACNRDESRACPPALAPQMRTAGGRRFVMPVDPVSDGTWIAASDAGLVAVLLNAYPPELAGSAFEPAGSAFEAAGRVFDLSATPLVSRGTIIPSLLAAEDLDALIASARSVDPSRFAPFRLVVADAQEVAELSWARPAVVLRSRRSLPGPAMFTSSGLGDELVDRPRRELFDHWFGQPAGWPAEQDAFHRHVWPEAPELSVCMSRDDACTVSYTTVEIGPDAVTLSYFPAPPNRPTTATVVRLARR